VVVLQALRTFSDRAACLRVSLGWGIFVGVLPLRQLLTKQLPTPWLLVILLALIAVIVVCAFGVVTQAEHLARRLGEPYGTLILTLSIVVIEVILIAAVLLGPGHNAFIARDSVLAVSMIILNLVARFSRPEFPAPATAKISLER